VAAQRANLIGWTPLTGRWLVYAGRLAAAAVIAAALVLSTSALVVLLLGAALCGLVLDRSPAASRLRFWEAATTLVALVAAAAVVQVVATHGPPAYAGGFTCGTCSASHLNALRLTAPCLALLGVGAAWCARESRYAGPVARCATLPPILLLAAVTAIL